MLCRGRRSDHAAAEMLGNLRGGDADTASDRMDQNCLVGFQRTHHDEKLPSREIVDRDRSGFERGHACRALEYLFGRNADRIGVAAEPVKANTSRPTQIPATSAPAASTRPADLVARHDRHGRQIRIKSEAAENVCEINSTRLNANTNLSGFRFGVGRFPHFENFRWARFGDPDLPHRLTLPFRTESAPIVSSKDTLASNLTARLLLGSARADDIRLSS